MTKLSSLARRVGKTCAVQHVCAFPRSAWVSFIACLLLTAGSVFPADVSPLYLRGYTVMPEPQRVELKGGDFTFDSGWRIEAGQGVEASDVAIETLREPLARRYQLTLSTGGRGKPITLVVHPGSVSIGEATDTDKAALEEQAYRLELSPQGIRIAANASAGLFYGAETLVELVKRARGRLWLPEGEIVDWPDVRLRELFWDQLRHLDHFDVMKQAIRRAAFFKANALTLRLNEHFAYANTPALVDPYALTPAQLQELTDYGLHYHVQVIPYLDGPAHTGFILERGAYARLREFPQSSFEMCSTNPETIRLLEGMDQELMNATKGVKYFHFSTDEPWFVGLAHDAQCNEAERAKELGSPSKVLAQFTTTIANYLKEHGRQVIFWGEDPLRAEDIPLLPRGLINGELYGPVYNKAFRADGISQMIYTNSLPDDPLFPAYFVLSPKEEIHPRETDERATEVFNEISYNSARQEASILGAGVYAWGDLGPHPETFWLGYAVGAAAAWHPASPGPDELTHTFFRLFYGQGATGIGRLYQLMSTQAQFWATSWESEPSSSKPLVFGYSYGIGPFVPHIQTLPLPPVPTADYLVIRHDWSQENARRIEQARKFLGENDELLNLLYSNLPGVEFNRYNLEVYLSIAKLLRQNLTMITRLDEIANDLERAETRAAKLQYAGALRSLDQALDAAGRIRDGRNQARHDATTTWYKAWFPRVREANGRHVARDPQRFVDTLTSEDARRRQVGLAYLIDREFEWPFGEWVRELQTVRNRYAAAHGLPARQDKFDWQDTTTLHSQAIDRAL